MAYLNRRRGVPARSRRLPNQSPRKNSRNLLFEQCEPRDLFAADLSVQLWHDFNADGVRDAGDNGLRGGVVELYSTTDAVVGNADDVSRGIAVTNADGVASFANLNAGLTYHAQVRPPVGQQGSTPNFGFTSQDADSDVDAAGRSALFTVTNGITTDITAGVLGSELAWGWALTLGTPSAPSSSYSRVTDVAVGEAGYIYAIGYVRGRIDLDPGPAENLLIAPDNSFVAKYTPEGAVVWAHYLEGNGNGAKAVALDGAGNVIVAGYVYSSDFDPGPGTDILTSNRNGAYVWKLNSDGEYQWARVTGGASAFGNRVAVNAAGEIAVSGSFSNGAGAGTITFGDGPEATVLNDEVEGMPDSWVWRLNADGDFQWVDKIPAELPMNGLAIDSEGNVDVGAVLVHRELENRVW